MVQHNRSTKMLLLAVDPIGQQQRSFDQGIGKELKIMQNISIIKYQPYVKEALIDFLSHIWRDQGYEERKAIFEWKYEKNPYHSESLCYIALDGEKVVGFRAFVPHRFIVNSRKYTFGTPADTVVHPDYRRRGIFSKLSDFGIEDVIDHKYLDMLISLSSSKVTSMGNIQAGFVPVGKRLKMYRFSLVDMLKSKFAFDRSKFKTLPSENGIEISRQPKIKNISKLMQDLSKDKMIVNDRDENFYMWRFRDSPDKHIYIYYWVDNELISYMSLRIDCRLIFKMKFRCYTIMEYGYRTVESLGKLTGAMIYGLSPPVSEAYIFTRDSDEISILKNSGFKGSESYIIRNMDRVDLPGLLVRSVNRKPVDSDFILNGVDLRDQNNWSLFLSSVH